MSNHLYLHIISFIFVLLTIFSAAEAKSKTKVDTSSECSLKRQELQDCHLKLGPFPIHLWKDKIILRGPKEREMVNFKLEPNGGWDQVQKHQINDRYFLELTLWGAPQGQAEVASATSYIYEIQNGKIDLKHSHVVQKRRKISDKKFELDARKKIVFVEKNHKIYWQVDNESGEL
jgi:hypothetical protein